MILDLLYHIQQLQLQHLDSKVAPMQHTWIKTKSTINFLVQNVACMGKGDGVDVQ